MGSGFRWSCASLPKASRSSGVFTTAFRWPTMPHARPRRSFASMSGWAKSSQVAGPSVLVWTGAEDADSVLAALAPSIAGWGEALRIRFSADGAGVSAL
jgi:hypothetical protein